MEDLLQLLAHELALYSSSQLALLAEFAGTQYRCSEAHDTMFRLHCVLIAIAHLHTDCAAEHTIKHILLLISRDTSDTRCKRARPYGRS
jgi:hypothetical protein